MALSSFTYLRSVMLVERFLLEGRWGFAELLNIIRETGLCMVRPVDDLDRFWEEKSGCHCCELCRVSAGEPGDGGEFDCEVPGVGWADVLDELGLRACPWAALRLRSANWSVGAPLPEEEELCEFDRRNNDESRLVAFVAVRLNNGGADASGEGATALVPFFWD
jgi:hypothetical protein